MPEGSLIFNLTVPAGYCGLCGRPPGSDEHRLDMKIRVNGRPYSVTACRPCLAEQAPELLEAIEEE